MSNRNCLPSRKKKRCWCLLQLFTFCLRRLNYRRLFYHIDLFLLKSKETVSVILTQARKPCNAQTKRSTKMNNLCAIAPRRKSNCVEIIEHHLQHTLRVHTFAAVHNSFHYPCSSCKRQIISGNSHKILYSKNGHLFISSEIGIFLWMDLSYFLR